MVKLLLIACVAFSLVGCAGFDKDFRTRVSEVDPSVSASDANGDDPMVTVGAKIYFRDPAAAGYSK
jgi:hypothetical protein